MAANKTIETNADVTEFIKTIDEKRQQETLQLIEIYEKTTGFKAKMWGPSIIGFGSYHYRYDSGREGDAPLNGFSSRKDKFALYFDTSFPTREVLLDQLGKHKAAKACVYIKKIEDIDLVVLKKMMLDSAESIQKKNILATSNCLDH